MKHYYLTSTKELIIVEDDDCTVLQPLRTPENINPEIMPKKKRNSTEIQSDGITEEERIEEELKQVEIKNLPIKEYKCRNNQCRHAKIPFKSNLKPSLAFCPLCRMKIQ